MGCLCCGAVPDVGALCRPCALEVPPCDGLIPDHVRSTVDATATVAWVVDGFGGAHPIAATTAIGRNPDGGLVLLASSVSRAHAELVRAADRWTVRDLGSRNGTFVDGVRCQGRTALAGRARLKVGHVALWFLAQVAHAPDRRELMLTDNADGGVVRYQLVHRAAELCIVGGGDATVGGSLLSRAVGATAWSERQLAPLEFQLLRALCARAQDEVRSPSTVRGCIPTKQLARALPFQSKYANEDNVRQVVRRLRGILAEVGASGLLAIAPGRGYYVAGDVTVAAPDVLGAAR